MNPRHEELAALLNDDQRRALSTRLALLDRQLTETEALIVGGRFEGAMFKIENRLSPNRTQQILALLQMARAHVARLRDRFELSVQREDLARHLAGHFGILWTILENSRAAKLKGFGDVPDQLSQTLDPEIDALVEIVQQIRSLIAPQ